MEKHKVLIIEDQNIRHSNVMNSAINMLCKILKQQEFIISRASSYGEALPILSTDMDIDAILLAIDLDQQLQDDLPMEKMLETIKLWQHGVPLFMLADREVAARNISTGLMAYSTEFVWILEDSPVFISGRISAAVNEFRRRLLPPLMNAIWE